MPPKKYLATLLLAVTSTALACAIFGAIITPTIKLSPYSKLSEKWKKIGDELGSIYGDKYKDVELVSVRVPVVTCIAGICGASIDVQFYKPCGQTLKNQAYQISTYGPGGNNDGAGGAGGGGEGGGLAGSAGGDGGYTNPFQHCSVTTIRSCLTSGNDTTTTNCRYDNYLECPYS